MPKWDLLCPIKPTLGRMSDPGTMLIMHKLLTTRYIDNINCKILSIVYCPSIF